MKNANYKVKEIKVMMRNYIFPVNIVKTLKNIPKCRKIKYKLIITNILMGMIQYIHVVGSYLIANDT